MIRTSAELMRLRLYADELEWQIKAAMQISVASGYHKKPVRTARLSFDPSALRLCELRSQCLAAINVLLASQTLRRNAL